MEKIDELYPSWIEKNINTKYMAQNVILIDTVSSTNDECRKIASECEEGTVIIAEEQTGGKGRLGRVWSSPRGSGIWMSFILKPTISAMNVPSITLVAGLAVCKALRKISGLNAGIKWPNDIHINGKKVCGILTEMSASSDGIDFVVVGIGINVNTEYFPQELENIACSLYTETCKKFERNVIIKEIFEQFESIYEKFKIDGFSAVRNEYEENCINIGKRVKVISSDSFEALAVGVDDSGSLIVRKDNGEEIAVFSGEVSIRNSND